VDAVGWLWHLGGEGGLQVLELWDELTLVDLLQVEVSLATSWHAGELNSLLSHLGVLGLARWTTLGDWDLGEAHLDTALDGQVPQEGALASGRLVSLGDLGWVEGDLGALLGLLLQLRHEWGWDGDGAGSGANLWDGPGSNLKLWLGVDAGEGAGGGGAVGAGGGEGLLEGSAETSNLVLQEWRWDDLELLAVGGNLLKKEAWGLDDNNTVGGPEEGGDDSVGVGSKDASDLDLLTDWELNLLGVDSDNWAGARWDDLNLVLLQQDVGLQQVLGGDWGNQDHEPAVGGSVMSNHEGVSVGNLLWEGDGLAVELDEGVGVGVDPAHLGDSGAGGKDGAGGDLGDTEDSVVLDSGQWEEEVEWVDNADVLEDEGLPWGDDLHVQGWDGLGEGQLNSGPGGSLHKVWWSVWWWLGKSAGRWSVVWPQVGGDDIKDGLLNNAEVLWHVDELSLEDNLVQGGGLDANNLLQLSNLLGGNKGGVSGLGGNQLLQQLGFWGLNGEGLLGLSGHGVASDNDLGLLAGDMGDNDVVLEVEVDEGVAELLNVPHWEDWDGDVALHGNLLNLGLWDLGLKEDVPLLVDGLGGELVLGTKSSSQGEGEGPWPGRLEDEVGGEGEASDGSLRDLGGLKLRHDHLQVVLATLMDLGLDAVGDNLQWAQGLDDLHDGWVGPDLLDLLVGETRDWGLLQGVVLDASLALNLGGSSDLDLQTKSLGGSPGWLQEGGHLVVANRWDKVLRKSWGSPAEDQHVDWVLVDVQVLNNGPHVDEPGLSDQLGLEAKTQVLSEGGLQDLPLWDSLDGLEGWGHGDWLELVDLANSGVWQDVVVGKSGWLVGDWLDHDGQLLGWDVQLHLNGSWDVDDGVLVNTGGNVLRGEWNKSSDKSGVLGGEEDLSIDGDRWGHGESVDGGLSGQGSGDWGTDLNNDWESHVRSQHDLDWGKVDGLLGVDGDGRAGAREELGWVLEELSKLLGHDVGGLLSQGAEDDSSLSTLEESGGGEGLGLDGLLEAELLNDLGHLGVDGALDLRLQLLWGASRGSGDLSDDLGELVKDGVSAGEDEASLGNIDVVLLEEEGEASVARPWEDLLLSSNPGKGGPVSGVQSPQELSLVEGGGGWDNAVGLPDHTVSKPGLGGQLNKRLWEHLQGDWGILHWDIVTNGVEGNVDDLEELHVHAWLHPGGGGNGVEDVLWSVELQEGVEGGDPHLGGLGWVGEDRGQDWDDQVWVLEAGVHQGVDSKDPGNRVPGTLDSGKVNLSAGLNHWGQLSDDILVTEQAKGHDVDVADVLLQDGGWGLVKGTGQVWDEDLLDNLGLWGAELAEDVDWVGGLPVLSNAGGVDQLGQASHSQGVGGWDSLDGLNLGDKLEQALQDLLGWGHDVAWQEHEEGVDLVGGGLTLTDHLLEELDRVWGSGHDDGVQEELPHGLGLVLVQAVDKGGVQDLDLLDGLKGGHATDSGQEEHVDLGLGELLGRLAADNKHDVLEDLGDLIDKLRLGWGGLGVQALEHGLWDGLGQDLAVVDLGGWDPALLQELLGAGAGDKGAGGQTVGLLSVLKHEGLEGDWVDWHWDGGARDGLDLLQPQGLEGAGDDLLGLGAHQLEVELTVVDNVLDGQASGAGAASNVPGVGGPGDDLGLLSLEEVSWADEGEGGGLLAVGEVDSADHLVELLLWASLWVWDQQWVLLDHVLWELVGLVGGQALAGNGLLHNLPEWADLGRGLDHVGRERGLHLDLEEGDNSLLVVDGPLWLGLGDLDGTDGAGLAVKLDQDWHGQDPLELLWDLKHLWEDHAPPVGTAIGRWNGLLRVEDIVDLDELWGGDDEGEGGLGLGDQANSGVDGQTGVLVSQLWDAGHETTGVLEEVLLAGVELQLTAEAGRGSGGEADNHEKCEVLHLG